MRVFVTGATGFAGSHLIDQLLAAGDEVTALVHRSSSHQDAPQHDRLKPVSGDLLDAEGLKKMVVTAAPEVIYHLAGQASPGYSWKMPAKTFAINTGGTANILDAAVAAGKPRVIIITSAEIYGPVRPHQLPLTEKTIPAPHHPYGISKQAAGQLVQIYADRYGLPVIEARPFNHIGPRQALGFVVPDFASQLAAIKLGQQPPIMSVGNLDAQRDFTDVRDIARAYRHLAASGQPGHDYLICSAQPVAIQYLLNTMVKRINMDVTINRDPARMRPSDTPTLYGSYAKIERDTGWRPEIHLQQTLFDALDDWIERLQNK